MKKSIQIFIPHTQELGMVEDSTDTAPKFAVEPVDQSPSAESGIAAPASALPSCCVQTIRNLVRDNPMMVCSHCKFIIKCFTDERAYQNYLIFCRSRRRPVVTGLVDGYFTCAFRSYDTFAR